MKTFLVYSKKPAKFVLSNEDISSLRFIQYGFNWKYGIDIFSVLYAIRRKFYVFAAAILILYILFAHSSAAQTVFLTVLAFTATSIEFLYLKKIRGYQLIGTVEAKNQTQAREFFLKEYILPDNNVFITHRSK